MVEENPHYLKVVLNKDALIIEFECTLRDIKFDFSNVIGTYWFDNFISNKDREHVFEVFHSLFNDELEKWKTYNNDVRFPDATHRFIDFNNEMIFKDGEKFISSFGVEHIDNIG